jgi:small subunit ribosomal protein S8
MVNDQTSDLLTRIRNAGRARLTKVEVLNSKLNRAISEILVQEGYLKGSKEVSQEGKSHLRLYLRFQQGDLRRPVIQGLRRVSRPGLRRYVRADRLPRVMSGFGLAILSTSRGLLTDREAKKQGIGGEHLCSVW